MLEKLARKQERNLRISSILTEHDSFVLRRAITIQETRINLSFFVKSLTFVTDLCFKPIFFLKNCLEGKCYPRLLKLHKFLKSYRAQSGQAWSQSRKLARDCRARLLFGVRTSEREVHEGSGILSTSLKDLLHARFASWLESHRVYFLVSQR